MRLNFYLTNNTETVPFDYQHFLIGIFHKWMGWNNIHDEISLYSLSWLQGAKPNNNGFNFPKGAHWFVSFYDEAIGKQLIKSVMNDNNFFLGMNVKEIQIQETPEFGNRERFTVASPIFIRKYDENKKAKHLTFKDKDANYYLTETLKKKLRIAKLNDNVKVSFDENYYNPKTKLVKIKGVKSRANFCPVIIEGDPKAVEFAWNVGIGHSTGSGFGALL